MSGESISNYFESINRGYDVYVGKTQKGEIDFIAMDGENRTYYQVAYLLVNPKYKTSQVILPLLLGLMLRIESMNELKYMLKENEFGNVFRRGNKLPQIDTIRDTLKANDLDGLEVVLENTVKKAISYNKEPCGNYQRHCTKRHV